jgi:uncharacterized membrane protein
MKPVKFSWTLFAVGLAIVIILCWVGGVNGIAAENPNHTDNDGILQAFAYALAHGNVAAIVSLLLALGLAIWVVVAAVTGSLSDRRSLNDKADE